MKHFTALARCLTLLLAAAMLSGMLALAEPAAQTDQPEGEPGYDIVYSSSNPIPAIAARVRPAIVQLNTKAESWDPLTRVAEVKDIGGGSACYIRQIIIFRAGLPNTFVSARTPVTTTDPTPTMALSPMDSRCFTTAFIPI